MRCKWMVGLFLWLLADAGGSYAQKAPAITFVRHVLDANSTFPACAALDVNADGKLDVVAGGWWYEAPSWKRHLVREVQSIRGRFDDYSNLPLDVDGDGYLDLISANYRSESIYWVRHPGEGLGTWRKHVIAAPGAMETGRLVDVDGDGNLDLLPNGVQFAAWWELDRATRPAGPEQVRWIRHDLPPEVAGHGIGLGDIDGDGRGDLVCANGWFRAPEDRRRGRWVHFPEFRLPRDGSIPLLVLDVDADGDQDVVWGRGHDIGLYWLEQGSTEEGQRSWTRHAIDTSWSQPHSLVMADINGDGKQDLVAGKRYMGHDGKDPGEYDPLVIYWYEFVGAARTWRRHPISLGGRAGLGLDPKVVDLDGDGDLDVLAPGRSGLFWFEHRRADGDSAAAPEAAGFGYPDHRDLTRFRGEDEKLGEVKTPEDWAIRRAHILLGMQEAMGPLPSPSRRVPLQIEIVSVTETPHYLRRKITFQSEPGDRVPAYLLIPKNPQAKAPAMLCLHSTIAIGKDQVVALGGKESRQYADQLARRGYVCLAPDYPSFGEYAYDFQQAASACSSGSMKAIWNNLRAVDVLQAMPEVDEDRIGCIGHSLGGHNALFTAVMDQRLRAIVTSCGFTGFQHYYGGDLKGWTSPRYMPLIASRYQNDPDRMPFDFHEVIAALAPRPVFINAPLHDSNFEVQGVRQVVDAARAVYRLRKAESRLTAVHPDCGHDFPAEVRETVYQWLDQQLK